MRSPLLFLIALAASLSAFGQTNFASLAADGAWTWYNDPRAVVHNGILYFGYVRNGDGRSVLSAFNPQTGATTVLWSSSLVQKDDHNNPGLLVKQDGTMLAIHARHGSDQFFTYRLSTSTNPVSPSDWGPEQTIAGTGAGVTYANPYQLSAEPGRIFDFMRDLNFNPTVILSTNGGSSWSTPRLFIQTGGGGVRPYVKYASDYQQRIDFLYTDGHPRDVTNSLYHLYYQGGTFYKTDGALVKTFSNLPIAHEAGERGSVIYQYSDAPTNNPNAHIASGRAWCWETAYQTNGNPVCVFTVQSDQVTGVNWFDDRIYYYYARWTGTNWQKRFIAHAGRPLYQSEDDYAGGICVDPQDPSTIYISSNAQNPFDLSTTTNVPLRANNRYEIFRGSTSDGGLTFTWQAVTTNSTVDNLRPYVPRGQTGTQAVIWFRGAYASYTSYNCEVVGLFPNPLPEPIQIKIVNPAVAVLGLTNLNNELKLVATIVEDGLPQSASISWTTASGPTNAIFSKPNELITTARFPTNGVYVLRVTADDTVSSPFAEVTVSASTISVDGPDATCVLWQKLNSSSGVTAIDSSGNGNNGTLSGGTIWRPAGGIRQGALELDGSSGQIVVPDAAALDGTSTFTLAYWFLANNYLVDSAGLVSKRNSLSDNNAYTTYLKNDQHIYVDIVGSDNRFSSSTIISTGQWYHVAVTFDGAAASSQRVKLWINGQLDVTAAESSAAIPNYTSSLRIGNTHPGATNFLSGLVDDVRFYRRALSSEEIAVLGVRNLAPSITASAPAVTNGIPAVLNGTVIAGSSTNSLSTLWSKLSGPGDAAFGEPVSSTATSVVFNRSGNYTLQLSAWDGQMEVSRSFFVAVAANTNVFEDWAAFVFPGQTNLSIIGAAADPEGDGIGNFVEFALGLNPNVQDAVAFQMNHPGLPLGTIINVTGTDYLALMIKRPIGRIGLRFDVEASGDLQTWTLVNASSSLNNGDSTETLTYRDVVSLGAASQRFMRWKLNKL